MSILEQDLVNPYKAPMQEAVCETAEVLDIFNPREDEGFLIHDDSLYHPVPGMLIADREKPLQGGSVKIASYISERASHRVGVYVPNGYDPESKLPKILMTTPLMTGVKGHNQKVAEEMIQAGYVVILKGPPRYHHPTIHALSLKDDTNEMFGVVQEVERLGMVGGINELWVYGESQAAMKGLAAPDIAEHYGKVVVDGLLVAPCYMRKMNVLKPVKQIRRIASMAISTANYASHASPSDLLSMRGTITAKDMNHHIAVIPVLIGGETGTFLPHIKRDQQMTVQLFGKDDNSTPHETKADLESHFPNMDIRLDREYGHVDGIMSLGVQVLRQVMLFETRNKYDVRHNAA